MLGAERRVRLGFTGEAEYFNGIGLISQSFFLWPILLLWNTSLPPGGVRGTRLISRVATDLMDIHRRFDASCRYPERLSGGIIGFPVVLFLQEFIAASTPRLISVHRQRPLAAELLRGLGPKRGLALRQSHPEDE